MFTRNAAKFTNTLAKCKWLAATVLLAPSALMLGQATGTNPHPLIGQLLMNDHPANVSKEAVVTKSSTVVLQAVITPTSAESATLTRDVTFYEGTTPVGTAALLANRTTAQLTLAHVAVGTHTYTARYPADGYYAAYTFPSVSVAVQDNSNTPALISAYVMAANNASALPPGGSLQFTVYGNYSDGSSAPLPDTRGNTVTLWNTNNYSVGKVSTLGRLTAMGLGRVAIEATVDGMQATPWAVTVRPSSSIPVVVGSYVLAKNRATTFPAGGTLQFTAYVKYDDGTFAPLPDIYGNKVTLWNTSDHDVAKISTLGHATGYAAGAIKIEATVGTMVAMPWAVKVTDASSAPAEPLSVSCAVNPAVVNPGGSALITATTTSAHSLPVTYHYSSSAGTISQTGTVAKLESPANYIGPISVACTASEEGGSTATASTAALVSKSSGNLVGSTEWKGVHDLGTPGTANGSTRYPVAMAGYSSTRNFSVDYAAHGGERYSISFGHDANATHFVYEASIYIVDPSQLANLEMDMNQVTPNGDTVIFGTQCSGYSKTWEYTTSIGEAGNRHPRWVSSNLACNPASWEPNTWHHVQIASSRNSAGVVSYDWVNLDGVGGTFKNAVGPSSFSLGWAAGDLLLNFQLDGASKGNGTMVAYLEDVTIYRW